LVGPNSSVPHFHFRLINNNNGVSDNIFKV